MWIFKFMVTTALLALAALGLWVWRTLRQGSADYLPHHWDFAENKQEERL